MIAERALDYTAYAPPLTVDDVRRDLDAYYCAHVDSPEKIIVWIHQWDYLTKKYKHLKEDPEPQYIIDKVDFNDRGDLCGIGRIIHPPVAKGQLWGIPVEVREP